MSKKCYIVSDRDLPHISYQRIAIDEVVLTKDCCLDIESTGLSYLNNNIIFVILGNKDIQYVVDYNFVDRGKLIKLLSNDLVFIGHNLSFDLPFLIERGFSFNTDQIYDTMETELSLVKGTNHSVSLANTLKRRLGVSDLDKGITIEFTYMSPKAPHFEDRHVEYAYKDVLHLEDLRDAQMKHINRLGQSEMVSCNNAMVVVASYMKTSGMYLNKEKWMEVYYKNLKRCDELELELDEELKLMGLAQKPRIKERNIQTDMFGIATDVVNKNLNNINYSSPDQIKHIFRYFKQPIPKVNKKVKGKSVEKDTTGTGELEEYLLTRPKTKLKRFIEILIEYRVYSKRVSTYGKKFLEKHLYPDGRIHPSFQINRTATGRMSSKDPNAQNIPALEMYRSCFEGEGTNNIFTCDLSSAELRILASLADDEVLKGLYANGEDLHSYLAQPAFRYVMNDPNLIVSKRENSDLRTKMKGVNFSIVYGASASKVASILNVSKTKGEYVLDIMKQTIPKTFAFLESQERLGQTVGMIKFESKWNQIRYFEQVAKGEEVSKEVLAAIGREAKNCAIQGVNAQQIKLALVNIFNYIRKHNLESRLISSVHDEVVIEVIQGEESHCDAYVKLMEQAGNYFMDGVNIIAEGGIKKVWSK